MGNAFGWVVVCGSIALLGRVVWFAGSWLAALAACSRENARMLKDDNDAQARAKPGFH